MKVILRSEVPHLGHAGDIKDVSSGFGRNYLIPRRFAVSATPAAVKAWELSRERRAKKNAGKTEEAKSLAAKLSSVSLSFSRPVGTEGKLFGSVGKTDIQKSLKSCGYAIDKNCVVLDSAIKQAGDYDVELRLMPEISAKIKVTVAPRE